MVADGEALDRRPFSTNRPLAGDAARPRKVTVWSHSGASLLDGEIPFHAAHRVFAHGAVAAVGAGLQLDLERLAFARLERRGELVVHAAAIDPEAVLLLAGIGDDEGDLPGGHFLRHLD